MIDCADMDVVFALAHNEGVSPVGVSLRKDVPLAGSKEADIILGIDSNRSEKAESSTEMPASRTSTQEA